MSGTDSKTSSRDPQIEQAADLAEHVEESVDALTEFHGRHYRAASGLQRTIDYITEHLGRPASLLIMVLIIASWMALTAVWTEGGVEHPAFAWLELAATLAALLVAMLILVTQRREDQLAERRAQLTLELALLADKKSAKIIALLEELRRDHPDVSNRADAESDEMAQPADPQQVLAAIEERESEEKPSS